MSNVRLRTSSYGVIKPSELLSMIFEPCSVGVNTTDCLRLFSFFIFFISLVTVVYFDFERLNTRLKFCSLFFQYKSINCWLCMVDLLVLT